VADAWRKRHEQGGPCRPVSGAHPATVRNRGARAMCVVRALPVKQRGRGETDEWAVAIVPSGGAADKRGPSGSGRGRVRRGTDRRDRPVWGARGPAREGKGWAEPR
jgi:hypothetical protein